MGTTTAESERERQWQHGRRLGWRHRVIPPALANTALVYKRFF
jgi:hypothetical protein